MSPESPEITLTDSRTGHGITKKFHLPGGSRHKTAAGVMEPDTVSVSWLFTGEGPGPLSRCRFTLWQRRHDTFRSGSFTYWGYDGVMKESPDWVEHLSRLVYAEALSGTEAAYPDFTTVESARTRSLEQRFTVDGAPPAPSRTSPGSVFTPETGMVVQSIGSGTGDSTSVWLWGGDHPLFRSSDGAEYRTPGSWPSWVDPLAVTVRAQLEGLAPPPGWDTHQAIARPA